MPSIRSRVAIPEVLDRLPRVGLGRPGIPADPGDGRRPQRSRAVGALLASMLLAAGCGGGGLLDGGYGLIGLIVVAFQIWAIVEVIQSGKETGTKVVWILVVLLLPVVGTILWFLLGRK